MIEVQRPWTGSATVAFVYQALLTKRYLTSKIMPLLASVAVALTVTTELVTWSVMGGFLDMLIKTGRGVIGDVSVTWPQTGFAHHEDLRERLEAHPDVEATTSVIETFGLLNLPGGMIATVSVRGIEGESYSRVTGFDDGIWWRPLEEPSSRDHLGEDPRLRESLKQVLTELEQAGRTLTKPDPATGDPEPGMVLGIEVVSKAPYRHPSGFLDEGASFLLNENATLQVLPTDRRGGTIEPQAKRFVIVNEAQSGVYEIDAGLVFIPLTTLQQMLKMDEAQKLAINADPFETVFDEQGNPIGFASPETVGIEPSRVTSVLVRGRDAEQAEELKQVVQEIYAEFAEAHEDVPAPASILIQTWQDRNRTLISAVKKETGLVLFIFGIISVTSVFLVLAIFWSMVSEKTRDVGILRALGASRFGVAWLWVRYGLAIGIGGSLAGGALAAVIVTNINEIHEWMGRAFGLVIWDPAVYYFAEVPSEPDPMKFLIIMIAGMLSSAFGALIPAWRAANMDPVKSLRFE